ncbi:MAG: shikimate dehydrogenase [Bacteroidales bacterium]|nr:shikimate dehydrogenase [Bacteroidales bacterium]
MKKYGLIGYPLSHSFSEKYFSEKFKNENIKDSVYKLFPLEDIGSFPELIKKNPDIEGLNVTIPYKERIIKYLDELDMDARMIGAVNTIKIVKKSGKTKLIGYNTDAKAFEIFLKNFLKQRHNKALLLGSGGSSKAIQFVLKKLGIPCTVATRRPLKAQHVVYWAITKSFIESYQIIINTTPLGMFPDIEKFPDIPYKFLNSEHILFDLIYNPQETHFLKKGKEKGCITINGLKILELQADLSWKLWRLNNN